MRVVVAVAKIGVAGLLLLAAGCSFAASECPEPSRATVQADDFVLLGKEVVHPGSNAIVLTFMYAGEERQTVALWGACGHVAVGTVVPENCR